MSDESIEDYALGSAARLGLSVLAHKWTLLIVLALKPGPLRFSELRRRIPEGTAQVLTESLRSLERDGIVERQHQADVPPRVDYQLTAIGASMCAPATAIRVWGEQHGLAIAEARRRYDARDPHQERRPSGSHTAR